MTRDEIVSALRCHCEAIETGKCPKDKCPSFERPARYKCAGVVSGESADLIENQQRHIEALMKANDSLKDAIARRDKQIEDMKQGMAQLAKAVAVKEENDGCCEVCEGVSAYMYKG
jgi:predicted RNase H-like nuclease (RuvC/YqgF family)